jgi:hypothetical protein
MAQRNTLDTNLWLREQDKINSTAWRGLCLKLARSARNIGPMYPTAISAQHATPKKYRVYDLDKVKRGMVAYFDDPNDDNPAGHIVTVQGRDNQGRLLCWTNDVAGPGMVSLTPMSFFPSQWGDQFRFGATWLNGVRLDMPEQKKKASKPKPVNEENIRKAINRLDDAIKDNKGRPKLVEALERDQARLAEIMKQF